MLYFSANSICAFSSGPAAAAASTAVTGMVPARAAGPLETGCAPAEPRRVARGSQAGPSPAILGELIPLSMGTGRIVWQFWVCWVLSVEHAGD